VGEAAMIRRAWLQKHPTPAARGGEFHWYPADGDRELRAGLVEQLAGTGREVVLWQVMPTRVVWARTFGAVAPGDRRRYTGLAVAIAEGCGGPGALLARLVPSRGEPWHDGLTEPARPSAHRALPDPAAVARALIAGGAAAVGSLDDPGLPRVVGAIERRMPASVVARARRGSWQEGSAARVRDRVAELAIAPSSTSAARAWRLLCELAGSEGDLDALAVASERDDSAWTDTLNAWGRGRLICDVGALAERVGLRAFAALAAGDDVTRAVAEVRWYALLPRARRRELIAAVARRAPSLGNVLDG
jgi:hypothetical protein